MYCYIFIGSVGIGRQRRCKTHQSLLELDNQDTVFTFFFFFSFFFLFFVGGRHGWRSS